MASLLLAALLLAAAGPEAPVAPSAPVVPEVAGPSAGGNAAPLPTTATPTSAATATSTGGATSTSTGIAAPTTVPPPAPGKPGSANATAHKLPPHTVRKTPGESPALLDLSTPTQRAAAEPPTLPPALTGTALRDELRTSSQKRQEELAALARERAHLQKLSAEIEAARASLREETARLDERVKKAASAAAQQKTSTRPGAPAGTDAEGQALAKTLKSMKPEQAAALLAHLDRPLAVGVLRRMRPGDTAAVLEKMKPEVAAELFSNIAGGSK